ncbi:hypothetical protein [Aliihoeflea sp. 40Bstr573]|uniref:hypothetical protein n=1 Tax=Aliihoeflea sp. 40Bstr573 TaxID=2696467 RepID=UPI0021126BA8|nr:hypothetical protein [Aliihoeflea sp. 40Bstr573]
MSRIANRSRIGHNGGPPLDPPSHEPEWGKGGVGTYFSWKAAHRSAWKKVAPEIALMRERRAAALGLTYEEYALELLERGRFLQETDTVRIAEIKAARRSRRR